MSELKLIDELKSFIRDNIDSIEQIEVLLLMRENKEKYWNAMEVSKELRSAPESVSKRLNKLYDRKLVEIRSEYENTYKYCPQSELLDKAVELLAEAYKNKRFSVINLVFSRPTERLKTFSDAFRIKSSGGNSG
jgi:hypothetical protein